MTRVAALAIALVVAALLGAADGAAVRDPDAEALRHRRAGVHDRAQRRRGRTRDEGRSGNVRRRRSRTARPSTTSTCWGPASTGARMWSSRARRRGPSPSWTGTTSTSAIPMCPRCGARWSRGRLPRPIRPSPRRPSRRSRSSVLTSGPDFVINLKTAGGKAVKTMKTGTYTVSVRDRGADHNAHIVAPGYNRKTTLLVRG